MKPLTKTPMAKSLMLTLLTASAFVAGYAVSPQGGLHAASATPAQAVAPAAGAAPTLPTDFADIAAQQGPAVVNISVSAKVRTAAATERTLPDAVPGDPFDELFRRFQGPVQPPEESTHALGSGFIIDAAGLILTNAHVVANADDVVVKLTDRREFPAKVLGLDKVSDVALLKIDAHDLPTVRIGDPGKVRVGQWVVAIGSPFGMENTVTAGIVSAKARTLPDEGYVPFLQTDVPINPGNSGGPLFNANGEVVGINSQIYSRSGGYQGLSFAIPIDVAMKVEKQLAENGSVQRGRLGIGIEPVSPEVAASLGLHNAEGAMVGSVERGGPAARAGLQPGDLVLKLDGRTIHQAQELPALVADLHPGTRVRVTVWRLGAEREIAVTLGRLDVPAAG